MNNPVAIMQPWEKRITLIKRYDILEGQSSVHHFIPGQFTQQSSNHQKLLQRSRRRRVRIEQRCLHDYSNCLFSMELVRRPSYATRYRTVRDRYPGDSSPQRRTATIVRRVPESAIVEGKSRAFECQ